MERVLIIDDEPEICELIKELLSVQGFEVRSTLTPDGVMSLIEEFHPDLALVDYLLRGGGLDLIQNIRKDAIWSDLSLIVITGSDEEIHKVDALNSGADDYIVKPFSGKELAARVRAVLRRSASRKKGEQVETEGPEVLRQDGLIVDLKSHRVLKNNEEVYLTLTEFRILSELLKQPGSVLSRDRLRERALGNLNVTDRTIDVHMASLRKKLDQFADSIQTVRGVGYRYSQV